MFLNMLHHVYQKGQPFDVATVFGLSPVGCRGSWAARVTSSVKVLSTVVSTAGEHYPFPMAISLRLPDDAERRLEEAATRLNVPVADLAAAAIRDLLTRPAEDFEDAARRVMEKNEELYRRLS